MKTIKFLGLQVDFLLSVKRVKRVVFDLPDWADDAHLRQGAIGDWGTPDGKTKVCYFKGSKAFYIDVPDCKKSKQVSLTPMRGIVNGKLASLTGRRLVVDLYF